MAFATWARSVVGVLGVTVALVVSACGSEPEVRVLFVGNSLTHGHDVPGLVEEIAGDNGVEIDSEMIAPGGAFLSDHLADPEVIEALNGGAFDVVVLQEQSMATAHSQVFRDSTTPSADQLVALARAGGAEVVLFQTWAHLNGNEITGHRGFGSMQDDIVESYDELSIRTGAPVARVGDAFERSFEANPGLVLHHGDGVHASPAGAYLAALAITPHVTGRPVRNVSGHGEVDSAVAGRLIAVS